MFWIGLATGVGMTLICIGFWAMLAVGADADRWMEKIGPNPQKRPPQ